MTEQENYLAAASRIAAGIIAAKPGMGFPPPSADVANDTIAGMACAITDRLLDHVARRFPGCPVPNGNGMDHAAPELLDALRSTVREMAWDVLAADALTE